MAYRSKDDHVVNIKSVCVPMCRVSLCFVDLMVSSCGAGRHRAARSALDVDKAHPLPPLPLLRHLHTHTHTQSLNATQAVIQCVYVLL